MTQAGRDALDRVSVQATARLREQQPAGRFPCVRNRRHRTSRGAKSGRTPAVPRPAQSPIRACVPHRARVEPARKEGAKDIRSANHAVGMWNESRSAPLERNTKTMPVNGIFAARMKRALPNRAVELPLSPLRQGSSVSRHNPCLHLVWPLLVATTSAVNREKIQYDDQVKSCKVRSRHSLHGTAPEPLPLRLPCPVNVPPEESPLNPHASLASRGKPHRPSANQDGPSAATYRAIRPPAHICPSRASWRGRG